MLGAAAVKTISARTAAPSPTGGLIRVPQSVAACCCVLPCVSYLHVCLAVSCWIMLAVRGLHKNKTMPLPLLALPVGAPCDGQSQVATLPLSPEFFDIVLDCTEEDDPFGILASINDYLRWLKQTAIKLKCDVDCESGEVMATLTTRSTTGTVTQWAQIKVVATSGAASFNLTLEPTDDSTRATRALLAASGNIRVMYSTFRSLRNQKTSQ